MVNSGRENLEASNGPKYDNTKEKMQEYSLKFAQKQLEDNEVDFRKKVKSWNYSQTFWSDFEKYLENNYTDLLKYFQTPEWKSDFNHNFRKHSLKLLTKWDLRRGRLLKFIETGYSLENWELEQVKAKIWEKNTKEIELLINDKRQREELFLNRLLWRKVLSKYENNILDDRIKALSLNWVTLTPEQKDAFASIFSKKQVLQSDIEEILAKINDVELKKAIISEFIPTVSLKKLMDWWVLTRSWINLASNEFFEKNLADYWIDKNDILNYVWDWDIIDPEDVYISTLLLPQEHIDTVLLQEWLWNFVESLNKAKKEILEDLEKNWPKNFEEFKKILPRWWENVELASEGAFMSVDLKVTWDSWKTTIQKIFFRIEQIDIDWKTEFSLTEVSSGSTINPKASSASKTEYSYNQFLRFLESEKVEWKPAFYNHNTLLSFIWKKDNDFELWDESFVLSDSEKDRRELADLHKALKDKREELKQKIKKDDWSPITDAEVEQHDEYKSIAQKLEQKKKSNEEIENMDFSMFLEMLDEIDPDWKSLWLEKWIVLEINKWLCVVIEDIDREWRTLRVRENWKLSPVITFEAFYKIFKENKIKRAKKINTPDELLLSIKTSKLKDEYKKSFEWIWFSHWAFVLETWSEEEKKKKEVEYFTSDDWELFKVTGISWDKITFQYWEYEKSKDNKITTLKIDGAPENTVSLNDFFSIIKSFKLIADPYLTWKDEEKLPSAQVWDRHNSFISKIFGNFYSVQELIHWVHLPFEAWKKYLERWQEVQSARVALAIWHFLPEEIRSELEIKVEEEEAELMEKAMKELWKVDSPQATQRIYKWLLNKDTPEYKKEAWMIFMMEKYWTLTAKKLYPAKWKFLWYTAMWWVIWDEVYMKTKKACEDSRVPFTEEDLVFNLMKVQCSHHNPYWIHRRSRLHKEFKEIRSKWIDAEIDKWKKDWKDQRNVKDRIGWAIWEMWWWTTPNAAGWLETILDKWSAKIEDLEKVPFVLMWSWAAYKTDQRVWDRLKNLTVSWKALPSIRFMSYTTDMNLYLDTIVELAKVTWENSDFYQEALKIRENAFAARDFKPWFDEGKSVKFASDFWDKYWEQLSRAMNMLDGQKYNEDFEKTDKIILLESKKKDWNKVFKRYYDTLKWMMSDVNFKEDVSEFHWLWLTWLNTYEVSRQAFGIMMQGWFKNEKLAHEMWSWEHWVVNEVENISKRKYYDNEIENKNAQIEVLTEKLTWIIAAFRYWQPSWSAWDNLKSEWSTLWSVMYRWWIDLSKFESMDAESVLNWFWEKLIKEYAKNILDKNIKPVWTQSVNVNQVISWFKDAVNEDLYKPKA